MAESNRIFDLIDPFLEELQDIEFVLSDLRLLRSINTSVSTQLDNIGDILNVLREAGQDDVSYRVSLRLKIALNVSSGQPEAVISFIKDITASTNVEYSELYPAKVKITVDGTNTLAVMSTIITHVIQLLPSGVGIEVVYINPAIDTFAFGDEGAEVTDGEGLFETGYGGAQTAGAMVELTST